MATPKDLMITTWPKTPKTRGDLSTAIAVPGVKITGWWSGPAPPVKGIDALQRIWHGYASLMVEVDVLEDADGHRHQICAYARIYDYPQDWMDTIRESLELFVAKGAAIAWVGGWECFLQYSRDQDFSGCYAAFTAGTGLVGGGGLEEVVSYIDQIPDAVEELHRAVGAAGS